jgi:flagellar biosynthesis/type III secretory pathway protein FliH
MSKTQDINEELERLRFRARNDEASALEYARDKGRVEGRVEGIEVGIKKGREEGRVEREKWQNTVANMEQIIAKQQAEINKLKTNE